MAVTNTPAPASLPEEGGAFTYDVVVTNPGSDPVRIVSLVDSVYGDLITRAGSTCSSAPNTVVGPGQAYRCSFTATFAGEAGASSTNTVRVTVVDAQGRQGSAQAAATVTLTDVPPKVDVNVTVSPRELPEPGGTVTYTVTVTDTSNPETVTITALGSDIHGDLSGRGTCRTGVVLDPGERFVCSFTATVSGNARAALAATVTVTVVDNEGTAATAFSDPAGGTVVLSDVAPALRVTKAASRPTPADPAGTVLFAVTVTNTGFEPVVLEALVDDVYGDLAGKGTCRAGVRIGAAETYRCSFSAAVAGAHTDVVTATVVDDDGSRAQARAAATVDAVPLGVVVPQASATPAGQRSTVAFTGASVGLPLRAAGALVLLGTVLLGVAWRRPTRNGMG